MDYLHNLITEKSWKILQSLKGKFDFILIGGWACYLWSKSAKSKDIDIIVDFETLNKLKKDYNLKKNDNLKKYEIRIDEIDIDIYVPFYSKLTLNIEQIRKTNIEGFDVLKVEELLILKQGSEIDRQFSEKGEKDKIDIIGLLFNCEIDFNVYYKILKENKIEAFFDRLIKILNDFKDYKYFEMTPREFKIKKKRILALLKKFK